MRSSLPTAAPLSRGVEQRAEDASAEYVWQTTLSSRATAHRRLTASARPSTHRGQIVMARAGDHPLIHQLLVSVLHGPHETEFQLNLDRPGYHPSDRLLLRRDAEVVAHLRLIHRRLRFAQAWLPTCDLAEFACLPECQLLGDDTALLAAAEAQAAAAGAVLATALTDRPLSFAARGWLPWGGARCLRASPRQLLTRLSPRFSPKSCQPVRRRSPALNVRPWRYVEQQALRHLYDQHTRGLSGAPQRDATFWEWLLVRRGYDQILVAAHCAGSAAERDSGPSAESIVGYAFTRESDIVELVVSPDHPQAVCGLLHRIASDAIERDEHELRVFQPPLPACPAAEIHRAAWFPDVTMAATQRDLCQMVKVLDPLMFLRCTASGMASHARAAGVSEGSRLTLQLDGARVTLELREDRVQMSPCHRPRHRVRASGPGVSALLLGSLKINPSWPTDALQIHDQAAGQLAQRFFPTQLLWRSTLDDLPSRSV